MESRGTLFREIHKNTWLKRVTADNRKIPVGTKKPERYWVVFCVHDDCEALLEGYIEPRHAASHSPDWTVSLQTTLHISHTLVPSENEYEFVITLSGETVRFNAPTWEIMQEWVDTLRLKLREMKILSPKENLYSKLPEIRPPLLPTRDPNSPLPATPPVPAAIVPGVERIVNTTQTSRLAVTYSSVVTTANPILNNLPIATSSSTILSSSSSSSTTNQTQQSEPPSAISTNESQNEQRNHNRIQPSISRNSSDTDNSSSSTSSNTSDNNNIEVSNLNSTASMSSTSNTLTSNLIKMLYPVTTYCHQANSVFSDSVISLNESDCSSSSQSFILDKISNGQTNELSAEHQHQQQTIEKQIDENVSSLARTFANNVLADPNTSLNSKRNQTIVASTSSQLPDNGDSDAISVDSSVYSIYPTPEPIVIPRPQTTRGATSKSKRIDQNIENHDTSTDSATTNITIIQVSSAIVKEKVKISTVEPPITVELLDEINYKNNVQIIPSNFSQADQINAVTMVQVTSDLNASTAIPTIPAIATTIAAMAIQDCVKIEQASTSNVNLKSTTIDPIVGGVITNISIGCKEKPVFQQTVNTQAEPLHYEQVFVTQSPTITTIPTTTINNDEAIAPLEMHVNRIKLNKNDTTQRTSIEPNAEPSTSTSNTVTFSVSAATGGNSNASTHLTAAKIKDLPGKSRAIEAKHENDSNRRPILTRGLTEAVIIRPSRKDTNILRTNQPGMHGLISEFQANAQLQDSSEQRKRSSSTSDTQRTRNRASNNNVVSSGNQYVSSHTNNVNNNTDFRRAPAQGVQGVQGFRPNIDISLRASGRLTLREQQVMQLRREMMHPGGVRIQLRRKDCLSSIAFVDAFGAAWVSGWKQKEHPMLYNALHIGDQIISIAGITITNAKEANKIINNATGQFVEFIIRRVPFGRVYAIRREIERQCLGLIRDGNTATIVDVVPNSLSARHGLPPKAQSCDGLSLTFWVLTEINGRPLNLFFKENEVRDRLNSVGRDISILVQPSDLISKLKKQLKSLRNYKDYIVQ